MKYGKKATFITDFKVFQFLEGFLHFCLIIDILPMNLAKISKHVQN